MTKIVLTGFLGKSVLPQTLKGAGFSLISPLPDYFVQAGFRVGVKNRGKSCEMEFCHVLNKKTKIVIFRLRLKC